MSFFYRFAFLPFSFSPFAYDVLTLHLVIQYMTHRMVIHSKGMCKGRNCRGFWGWVFMKVETDETVTNWVPPFHINPGFVWLWDEWWKTCHSSSSFLGSQSQLYGEHGTLRRSLSLLLTKYFARFPDYLLQVTRLRKKQLQNCFWKLLDNVLPVII